MRKNTNDNLSKDLVKAYINNLALYSFRKIIIKNEDINIFELYHTKITEIQYSMTWMKLNLNLLKKLYMIIND